EQEGCEHDCGGCPEGGLQRSVAHVVNLSVCAVGCNRTINQSGRDERADCARKARNRLCYAEHAALFATTRALRCKPRERWRRKAVAYGEASADSKQPWKPCVRAGQ